MSKKRIYELAKEYGMSGQDLARKLRDLGISQAKSHMSALDEFEVLQAQGLLEAHGIVSESTGSDDSDSGGGLILRKKKKKKAKAAEDEPEAPSAEEEPAPAVETPKPALEDAPSGTDESVEAPAAEAEATPAAADVETPSADAEAEPAEVPPATPDEGAKDAETAAAAAQPEPSEPETSGADASEPPAVEAPSAEAAAATTGATPAAESKDQEEAKKEPETKPAEEAKKVPKRQGKVVGFIDLSKIKTAEKKRPESRRLRSRDDVAPDVMPTMGHDRRRAMMRGDRGPRGNLSASQLREREAGRFLRRRGQSTGPGRRGGGGGHRREISTESPYKGSSVKIESPITVKKLAETLSVRGNQLMGKAFDLLGFGKVNINSLLDEDTAVLLAQEFAVELEVEHEVEAEEALVEELKAKRSEVEEEHLVTRAPALAFLGHVDHGKTTLIDKIRETKIADHEAGGITQHIGAYQVQTEAGHKLSVIDTPGHAAFTAMRARGAEAVDIVVLVVAADAGVQPHTEEAINHARAAETPIVVAITKCDKPEANPERVKQQLAALNPPLTAEDWGGDTAMMQVSGITGEGVDDLLERVFLESEILELTAHSDGSAAGVVLEAEVQQGKGIVAHLLVKDGTLKRGDIILAGEGYGKVRSLHNDRGKTIEEAGPSVPVEVSGLSALPGVGDAFYVVESLSKAKEVAEERERKNRATSLAEGKRFTAETIGQAVADSKKSTINLIVRADVQGSVEVLKGAISELEHPEIAIRILNAGVGAVTESDVLLGSTAEGMCVAFNVGVNDKARQAADREGLEIRHYGVIYELLDDLKAMMEGLLAPEVKEEVIGHVEIRALFRSSRIGLIAGCNVIDGKITRDSKVRLLRDGSVVYTGKLASLKREKDDAKEVREGFDCGIVLHNYQDIKEGDIIEAFRHVELKRTLESSRA